METDKKIFSSAINVKKIPKNKTHTPTESTLCVVDFVERFYAQ